MNIYDCFMYFDEDLLLDIRLNVLDKYVKKFVITESTYLHSGKPKKLNFDYKNFSKFKDKIIYIVVDTPPSGIKDINSNDNAEIKNNKILDNSVKRENDQRKKLANGIKFAEDDDLILGSDLDEIPNLENFKFRNKITLFEQNVFLYKLNLIQPNFKWIGTRACKKKQLLEFQWLRNIKPKTYPFWRLDTFFSKKKYINIDIVNDGGWHFTNIKKPEGIHHKMSNFLHHLEYEESGMSLNDLKKIISEKKIMYDHTVDKRKSKWKSSTTLEKVTDNFLPEYLIKNKKKYINWFD